MARAGVYEATAELVADLRPDSPVVCLRPAEVEAAARRFIAAFPGDVLYAVKCNPHPAVLAALRRGGISAFDVASPAEVALIREQFGAAAAIHFNHPVKARAAIREAYGTHGVRAFVVDSAAELDKVAEEAGSEAAVSVRIATPRSASAGQHMSAKFGAAKREAADVLRRASSRGHVTGLAFHVGSQCREPDDFVAAIALAAQVRDAAGVPVAFLNVGGGFPAAYGEMEASVPPLEAYTAAIERSAERFGFPRLQCEPGRALVVDGCSILVQVQLRKQGTLYINDGIFGDLCELVYLNLRVPMRALRSGGPVPGPPAAFTLYGPTCDPVDVLPGVWHLPEGMREGDWIEIGQIGAYSTAVSTRFNGFFADTFVEVREPPFWFDRTAPSQVRKRSA